MVAGRKHADAVRVEPCGKLVLERVKAAARVVERGEGTGGELHLRGGLDGDCAARARHAEDVSLVVVSRLRVGLLQLLEEPAHAVRLAVRHRGAVVVHERVLELDAEPLRAAFYAAFEERHDGSDVFVANRLIDYGHGLAPVTPL